MARQIGGSLGCSVLPQVGGRATDDDAALAEAARDERRVTERPDPDEDVAALDEAIHEQIPQHQRATSMSG